MADSSRFSQRGHELPFASALSDIPSGATVKGCTIADTDWSPVEGARGARVLALDASVPP